MLDFFVLTCFGTPSLYMLFPLKDIAITRVSLTRVMAVTFWPKFDFYLVTSCSFVLLRIPRQSQLSSSFNLTLKDSQTLELFTISLSVFITVASQPVQTRFQVTTKCLLLL